MASDTLTHPAKKFFLITLLLMLLAFILALIAVVVPWTRNNRPDGTTKRIGLWLNCDEAVESDPLDTYNCRDNDLNSISSVTGGSKKCRGFFVATIVLTILTVIFAFLTLLLLALIIGKLWTKPIALAGCIILMILLTFGLAIAAWACWIVYSEEVCLNTNDLYPVQGYSWGWILMIFASVLALLALCTACLGLLNIIKFKPHFAQEPPPMYPLVDQPVYVPPQAPAPYLDPMSAYPPAVAPKYPVAGPY